jgi:hypothetical protein
LCSLLHTHSYIGFILAKLAKSIHNKLWVCGKAVRQSLPPKWCIAGAFASLKKSS